MLIWQQNFKLIGCILLYLLIGACTSNNIEPFSNARNTAEVITIIEDTLTIEQSTVSEVVAYIEENNLNCTEQEDVTYNPDFSEQEYDSGIACWESAPNADTPSSGIIADFINNAVSSWVFKIVFLFNNDALVDIRLQLNDRSP